MWFRLILTSTKSQCWLDWKNILVTKVLFVVSQVDQLQIVQSEIALLFNELETLRRQKHVVEEERAENDKQRDKEVFLFTLTLKKFLTKWKHFYKDAGIVHESFRNKTNRVIWNYWPYELNPRYESFEKSSTKQIRNTNP